jgi:hypothetical protein
MAQKAKSLEPETPSITDTLIWVMFAFEAGQRERTAGSTGARAAELISSGCGDEIGDGDVPFSPSTVGTMNSEMRIISKKVLHGVLT